MERFYHRSLCIVRSLVFSTTIIGLVSFTVLGIVGLPVVADAQGLGSLVEFLTPEPGLLNGGDVIVYIGQPQGSLVVAGCVREMITDAHPVQNAVATEASPQASPGSGRAFRIFGLVTTSQTSPVPNGTRLVNLVLLGACVTDGMIFDKWQGTVN